MDAEDSFSPIQAELERLSSGKIDEYYELHFCGLYMTIRNMVLQVFGSKSLAQQEESPWKLLKSKAETDYFADFVVAVCRPGISSRDWREILEDGEERSLVLQGVIMKALDEHVLSRPLFGASEEYEMLFIEEADTIVEGFTSAARRAELNSEYIKKHSGLTPHFWEQVDATTAQMTTLLKPILELVRGSDARAQMLHQRMHETVAYAAWMNLSMRMSPAITVLTWPEPGERYEHGQVNLSDRILGITEYEAEEVIDEGAREVGIFPMARVKVVVVPSVMRYWPGRNGALKGIVSYRVMRPHLVFYKGWDDDFLDQLHLASFDERLVSLKRAMK